jgi:CheY-like chemotaxis protein
VIENVRIMVVSPEAAIRDFVVDVLEFSVNRKVVGVENGRAALDILDAQGDADIVVCADPLPDISGRELLARVKRKRPQSIGILMAPRTDSPEAAGEVVDAYLESPTDTKSLFDLVQKFVVGGPKG